MCLHARKIIAYFLGLPPPHKHINNKCKFYFSQRKQRNDRASGRASERKAERKSVTFPATCSYFVAVANARQSVLIKSSNRAEDFHFLFSFGYCVYALSTDKKQLLLPTVNRARLAFFTCPRGKSQRTGKQICCFKFSPQVL